MVIRLVTLTVRASITRRTALRALMGGSGALFLASCTAHGSSLQIPATDTPPPPTPTPFFTATPPPITPTPDLTGILSEARSFFAIEAEEGVMATPEGEALVARIGGKSRAVALNDGAGWALNIPRQPADMTQLDPLEILAYQHELADAGYGRDLQLVAMGPGRDRVEGIPDSGTLIFTDWMGDYYARAAVEGASVRWVGQVWCNGMTTSGRWSRVLPDFIDGTEDMLDGLFMITLDDCHQPEPLKRILDTLDEIDVSATFYPCTPNLTLYPGEFQRMMATGHEIGFHTSLHSKGEWDPPYLSRDRATFEATVRDVTGEATYRLRTMRPPFGLWDRGGWMEDCDSAGLTTVMWGRSVGYDAYDWSIDRALTEFNSHILLMHARETDADWLRDNSEYMKRLKDRYIFTTATGGLLKGTTPLLIAGLQPTS